MYTHTFRRTAPIAWTNHLLANADAFDRDRARGLHMLDDDGRYALRAWLGDVQAERSSPIAFRCIKAVNIGYQLTHHASGRIEAGDCAEYTFESDHARPEYGDVETLNVGDRVEIHPASDMWMRGARFGVVTSAYQPRDKHVEALLEGQRMRTRYRVRLDNAPLARRHVTTAAGLRFIESTRPTMIPAAV